MQGDFPLTKKQMDIFMKFIKFTSIFLVVFSSGCASVAVNDVRINDQNLRKKAATALFTTTDKITISDKKHAPNPK